MNTETKDISIEVTEMAIVKIEKVINELEERNILLKSSELNDYNSGLYTANGDVCSMLTEVKASLEDYLKAANLTKSFAASREEHSPDVTFNDPVNHPSYYTDGRIEVIEFIADKGLLEGFCKGNIIKYVSRAGKKSSAALTDSDKELQDLRKARWYLDYLISTKEKKAGESK